MQQLSGVTQNPVLACQSRSCQIGQPQRIFSSRKRSRKCSNKFQRIRHHIRTNQDPIPADTTTGNRCHCVPLSFVQMNQFVTIGLGELEATKRGTRGTMPSPTIRLPGAPCLGWARSLWWENWGVCPLASPTGGGSTGDVMGTHQVPPPTMVSPKGHMPSWQ